MTNTSIATQSRIFVAWSVFLVELFDSIDLAPSPGVIEAFIPTEFINAGFGDASCLGDCTETKISESENFDVNNITFSPYKNHTTGKTEVWITPHGTLLQCSATYPGTISDMIVKMIMKMTISHLHFFMYRRRYRDLSVNALLSVSV